jgi:hypothetical protein
LLRAQALARSGDVDAAEHALATARAHRHPAYVYVQSTELLTEAWLAAARHTRDPGTRSQPLTPRITSASADRPATPALPQAL